MRGALIAAAWLAGSPALLTAQAADQVDLVRCAPGSSAPCFGTVVSLGADGARAVATMAPAALAQSWRARFRSDTALIAVARRATGRGSVAPARVLVLVDVSGSMKSEFRFVYTLSAIRFFLRQLDSLPAGSVRAGVAAFGSRGVAAGIAAARFAAPGDARQQVEAIRSPDRENTGLYSAIRSGIGRLETELAQLGDGGRGHLVVITDGNNEVGSNDDPDLLDGPSGLATAAAAVNESRSVVTILGIGNLNRAALETLAGERGRVALVSDAQFKLGEELAQVRDLLASTWEVAVPLGGSREELGRGFGVLRPRFVARSGSFEQGAFAWVPPLMALPAFGGSLATGSVDPSLGSGGRLDGRWILAAMLAVALVFLWALLPSRLWPAPVQAAASKATPKAAPDPKGLRLDVKEVAPRKPSDVTASKARRA